MVSRDSVPAGAQGAVLAEHHVPLAQVSLSRVGDVLERGVAGHGDLVAPPPEIPVVASVVGERRLGPAAERAPGGDQGLAAADQTVPAVHPDVDASDARRAAERAGHFLLPAARLGVHRLDPAVVVGLGADELRDQHLAGALVPVVVAAGDGLALGLPALGDPHAVTAFAALRSDGQRLVDAGAIGLPGVARAGVRVVAAGQVHAVRGPALGAAARFRAAVRPDDAVLALALAVADRILRHCHHDVAVAVAGFPDQHAVRGRPTVDTVVRRELALALGGRLAFALAFPLAGGRGLPLALAFRRDVLAFAFTLAGDQGLPLALALPGVVRVERGVTATRRALLPVGVERRLAPQLSAVLQPLLVGAGAFALPLAFARGVGLVVDGLALAFALARLALAFRRALGGHQDGVALAGDEVVQGQDREQTDEQDPGHLLHGVLPLWF